MIQKLTISVVLAAILFGCGNFNQSDLNAGNSNVDTTTVSQTFYPDTMKFDPAIAITVADLKSKIGTQDSMMVTVAASITETCTKMGCWMDIKDESGKDIKVRMKDHNFFVPKDGCEGKKCVIQGYAYRTTFSEEERLHYAMESDMPQDEIDKIKGPEDVLTITAHSVMIEDAPQTQSEEQSHDHDHDHEGHEHHDHEAEAK